MTDLKKSWYDAKTHKHDIYLMLCGTTAQTSKQGDSSNMYGGAPPADNSSTALLHQWLSALNGFKKGGDGDDVQIPESMTSEAIIRKLMAGKDDKSNPLQQHENEDGFSHFEELLIHQPPNWKEAAREYVARHNCDASFAVKHPHLTTTPTKRRIVTFNYCPNAEDRTQHSFYMATPLQTAFFHPDMAREARHDAIAFLLSEGASDDRRNLPMTSTAQPYSICNPNIDFKKHCELKLDGFLKSAGVSALDSYLVDCSKTVTLCKSTLLTKRAEACDIQRLRWLNDIWFHPSVIGQTFAKSRIVKLIACHFGRRHEARLRSNCDTGPLIMSFVGDEETGKTALARSVIEVLTEPQDSDETSLYYTFGPEATASVAECAPAISSLIERMSKTPNKVGVVVLDRVALAADVTFLLTQLNQQFSCGNVVFILTWWSKEQNSGGMMGGHGQRRGFPDAAIDAVAKQYALQFEKTYGTQQSILLCENIVPFVQLSQPELVTKVKHLIEEAIQNDGVDVPTTVQQDFAEYIANKARRLQPGSNPTSASLSKLIREEYYYWELF